MKDLGGLVGHEHRDLVDQCLEIARCRIPVTQLGDLVLDQRVSDDDQVGEHV